MAIVHRLANTDATTTVSFVSSTLYCQADTWQITSSGDGYLTSTFTLVAVGTDSAIAAAIQPISELAEQNRLFWEGTYRDPVWYEYSADGESAAKRALVKEIGLLPVIQGPYMPTLGRGYAYFTIAIVFKEEWEDHTTTTILNAVTCQSVYGWGTVSAQSGSFPARISKLILTNGPSTPLYKYWAGIKPTGDGISSFNGKWELENGTMGSDSGTVTDTTGGTVTAVRCTFAGTPSMAKRVSMTVDDACADSNYHHFTGRYNVLLRARVLASASTVTFQMKSGFGTALAPAEYKQITNTNYQFISLGEVLIPPMGQYVNFYGSGINRTFTIAVFAERNSSIGSVNMDCLCLVPADHYTSAIGCAVDSAGGYTAAYTHEDDSHGGYSLDASGNPQGALELGFRDWELPIKGGLFVICAERNGAQVRADTVDVTLYAVHRHRLFND